MPQETVAVTHDFQYTAAEDVALLFGIRLEQAHGEVLLAELGEVGDFQLLGHLH